MSRKRLPSMLNHDVRPGKSESMISENSHLPTTVLFIGNFELSKECRVLNEQAGMYL
jgi:hypothetical protein